MDIRVITQGRNDPPVLGHLSGQIIDYTSNPFITLCLVEEQSGVEPSVLVLSSDTNATVALKLPLSKLFSGANQLIKKAEGLGWKFPEQDFAERKMKERILEKLLNELVDVVDDVEFGEDNVQIDED